MSGKITPSPFNLKTVDDFFPGVDGNSIKLALIEEYGDLEKTTIVEMLESKNSIVREYAEFLFEQDYRPYTAKQWGIPPSEIDKSVLRRVPVLLTYKTGYFDDAYQCMPKHSYARFFERLLHHKNIDIRMKTDALTLLRIIDGKTYFNGDEMTTPVIYTGAIDELLEYKYGVLPYRSLHFEWKTEQIDSFQPMPVVAYPQESSFTRITEYKKLPEQCISGITTYAVEYPLEYERGCGLEPYYPVLTRHNMETYEKYRQSLTSIKNLFLCGRLAEYKYYNMDQVVKSSLAMCETIKERVSADV